MAQLTCSPPPSVHVCLVSHVKTNKTSTALIYDSLNVINRSFDEILQELEHLQHIDCFKRRVPIKSVELAVRETRAWTMFEILEVLHEREESEWSRLGAKRSREDRTRKRR